MKLYYSYLIFRIINAHLTHLFLKWRYFSFYITFKYALFENNPSVDYLFFTLILILPVTVGFSENPTLTTVFMQSYETI